MKLNIIHGMYLKTNNIIERKKFEKEEYLT
jgi:hypothetical protein